MPSKPIELSPPRAGQLSKTRLQTLMDSPNRVTRSQVRRQSIASKDAPMSPRPSLRRRRNTDAEDEGGGETSKASEKIDTKKSPPQGQRSGVNCETSSSPRVAHRSRRSTSVREQVQSDQPSQGSRTSITRRTRASSKASEYEEIDLPPARRTRNSSISSPARVTRSRRKLSPVPSLDSSVISISSSDIKEKPSPPKNASNQETPVKNVSPVARRTPITPTNLASRLSSGKKIGVVSPSKGTPFIKSPCQSPKEESTGTSTEGTSKSLSKEKLTTEGDGTKVQTPLVKKIISEKLLCKSDPPPLRTTCQKMSVRKLSISPSSKPLTPFKERVKRTESLSPRRHSPNLPYVVIPQLSASDYPIASQVSTTLDSKTNSPQKNESCNPEEKCSHNEDQILCIEQENQEEQDQPSVKYPEGGKSSEMNSSMDSSKSSLAQETESSLDGSTRAIALHEETQRLDKYGTSPRSASKKSTVFSDSQSEVEDFSDITAGRSSLGKKTPTPKISRTSQIFETSADGTEMTSEVDKKRKSKSLNSSMKSPKLQSSFVGPVTRGNMSLGGASPSESNLSLVIESSSDEGTNEPSNATASKKKSPVDSVTASSPSSDTVQALDSSTKSDNQQTPSAKARSTKYSGNPSIMIPSSSEDDTNYQFATRNLKPSLMIESNSSSECETSPANDSQVMHFSDNAFEGQSTPVGVCQTKSTHNKTFENKSMTSSSEAVLGSTPELKDSFEHKCVSGSRATQKESSRRNSLKTHVKGLSSLDYSTPNQSTANKQSVSQSDKSDNETDVSKSQSNVQAEEFQENSEVDSEDLGNDFQEQQHAETRSQPGSELGHNVMINEASTISRMNVTPKKTPSKCIEQSSSESNIDELEAKGRLTAKDFSKESALPSPMKPVHGKSPNKVVPTVLSTESGSEDEDFEMSSTKLPNRTEESGEESMVGDEPASEDDSDFMKDQSLLSKPTSRISDSMSTLEKTTHEQKADESDDSDFGGFSWTEAFSPPTERRKEERAERKALKKAAKLKRVTEKHAKLALKTVVTLPESNSPVADSEEEIDAGISETDEDFIKVTNGFEELLAELNNELREKPSRMTKADKRALKATQKATSKSVQSVKQVRKENDTIQPTKVTKEPTEEIGVSEDKGSIIKKKREAMKVAHGEFEELVSNKSNSPVHAMSTQQKQQEREKTPLINFDLECVPVESNVVACKKARKDLTPSKEDEATDENCAPILQKSKKRKVLSSLQEEEPVVIKKNKMTLSSLEESSNIDDLAISTCKKQKKSKKKKMKIHSSNTSGTLLEETNAFADLETSCTSNRPFDQVSPSVGDVTQHSSEVLKKKKILKHPKNMSELDPLSGLKSDEKKSKEKHNEQRHDIESSALPSDVREKTKKKKKTPSTNFTGVALEAPKSQAYLESSHSSKEIFKQVPLFFSEDDGSIPSTIHKNEKKFKLTGNIIELDPKSSVVKSLKKKNSQKSDELKLGFGPSTLASNEEAVSVEERHKKIKKKKKKSHSPDSVGVVVEATDSSAGLGGTAMVKERFEKVSFSHDGQNNESKIYKEKKKSKHVNFGDAMVSDGKIKETDPKSDVVESHKKKKKKLKHSSTSAEDSMYMMDDKKRKVDEVQEVAESLKEKKKKRKLKKVLDSVAEGAPSCGGVNEDKVVMMESHKKKKSKKLPIFLEMEIPAAAHTSEAVKKKKKMFTASFDTQDMTVVGGHENENSSAKDLSKKLRRKKEKHVKQDERPQLSKSSAGSDSDDAPTAVSFSAAEQVALAESQAASESRKAQKERKKAKAKQLQELFRQQKLAKAERLTKKTKEDFADGHDIAAEISQAHGSSFKKENSLFDISANTSKKRLPLEVLESLSEQPPTKIMRRFDGSKYATVSQPSADELKQKKKVEKKLALKLAKMKAQQQEYIPLESGNGATRFGIVPLRNIMASKSKLANEATTFRKEKLFGQRIKRTPISAYLAHGEKLKAASKG